MGEVMRFKNCVINFLARDDISRTLPGKSDKVKIFIQKFLSENPTINSHWNHFRDSRPKYILTTPFITRDYCLCAKHQTMALVLKAIRQFGRLTLKPMLEILQLNRYVDFHCRVWKRVCVEDKCGDEGCPCD